MGSLNVSGPGGGLRPPGGGWGEDMPLARGWPGCCWGDDWLVCGRREVDSWVWAC